MLLGHQENSQLLAIKLGPENPDVEASGMTAMIMRLLMEEILRSPVEVGSLSHYLHLFTRFFTSQVTQDLFP